MVLQTRGSTLRDAWSSTLGESGKLPLSEKCINVVLDKLRRLLKLNVSEGKGNGRGA